jgi:hypothetical protein
MQFKKNVNFFLQKVHLKNDFLCIREDLTGKRYITVFYGARIKYLKFKKIWNLHGFFFLSFVHSLSFILLLN